METKGNLTWKVEMYISSKKKKKRNVHSQISLVLLDGVIPIKARY